MNKLPRLRTLLALQFLIMAGIPVIVWLYLQESGATAWMGLLSLSAYMLQNRLQSRVEKQLDECARKSLNQADAVCLTVANVLIVAAIAGLLLEWDRVLFVTILSCCLPLEFLLRAVLFAVFDKVGIE